MQPSLIHDDPVAQAFHAALIADFAAGRPAIGDSADRWHAWLTGLGAAVEQTAHESGWDAALALLADAMRGLLLPTASPAHVRRAAAWHLVDLAGLLPDAASDALRVLRPVLELEAPRSRSVCRSAAEIALRAYVEVPSDERPQVEHIAKLAAKRWLDPEIPAGDFLVAWKHQIEDADALAQVVTAGSQALETASGPTLAAGVWAFLRLYRDDVLSARKSLGKAANAIGEAATHAIGEAAAFVRKYGLSLGLTPEYGTATSAAAAVADERRPSTTTLRSFAVPGSETLDGIELTIRLVDEAGVQRVIVTAAWDGAVNEGHGPADRELTIDLFVVSGHGDLARYRLAGRLVFDAGRGGSWTSKATLRDEDADRQPDEPYVLSDDTVFVRVVEARVVS